MKTSPQGRWTTVNGHWHRRRQAVYSMIHLDVHVWSQPYKVETIDVMFIFMWIKVCFNGPMSWVKGAKPLQNHPCHDAVTSNGGWGGNPHNIGGGWTRDTGPYIYIFIPVVETYCKVSRFPVLCCDFQHETLETNPWLLRCVRWNSPWLEMSKRPRPICSRLIQPPRNTAI